MNINQEFQKLIPALSEEEYNQLEQNIIADGCRDPLVVWDNTIIDGHNRYKICTDNNIDFNTVQKEFDSESDAKMWMISNQLGRRNLNPSQLKYLIGSLYNQLKSGQGGDHGNKYTDLPKGQNVPLVNNAETIGGNHGVTGKTVKRAGVIVEKIKQAAPEIEKAVMDGDLKISDAAKIAEMPENKQAEAVSVMVDGKATISDITNNKAHVSNNSGNNEWYTPREYIEDAIAVMGSIDLDPASSDIANKVVGATNYFTEDNSGLEKEWTGRLWMNPPYAQPLIKNFSEKLAGHICDGTVSQAIVLVNNATETQWFQVMAKQCSAICFPEKRIRFVDINGNKGESPLQGQAVLYFGSRNVQFNDIFSRHGLVFGYEIQQ